MQVASHLMAASLTELAIGRLADWVTNDLAIQFAVSSADQLVEHKTPPLLLDWRTNSSFDWPSQREKNNYVDNKSLLELEYL